MTRGETRVAKLEARIGPAQCGSSLCVKCVLAKIEADHRGVAWGGCNGRPAGLPDLFRLKNQQLAHLAGVSESATDEELAAVIAEGAEGGRE